ncbi:MAG: FHA domain-containing protein [Gemmatales bacterium]|nr:FHA domain-containing protein [Gemmatales bacterium]MDW7993195.1 FHA domain-containing protein [Gemmatales bacterium]
MAQLTHSSAEWVCSESDGCSPEFVGTGLVPHGFIVLRLRALDGSRTLEIHQPQAIIGRHSQADIRIISPEVSRHHCRLVFDSGQWYVEDLGSLNGTYVNDAPIERSVLLPGAVLRIANHAFRVDWPHLDSTVECPQNASENWDAREERARQILASIAQQLPE